MNKLLILLSMTILLVSFMGNSVKADTELTAIQDCIEEVELQYDSLDLVEELKIECEIENTDK